MTETMTQRALRKMFNPKPDTRLADALEVIEVQAATIEAQRAHINDLNARIEKLQREAGGLHDLLW